MKKRTYIQGMTFFVTPEMYREVKSISDEMELSLSELFRKAIYSYLEHRQGNQKKNPAGGESK